MTDLMPGQPHLRRVRLDLRAATYLNSAGMAVLVQLQKLGQPRGVEVVLVAPPTDIARPLQLSGLWLRFPVEGTSRWRTTGSTARAAPAECRCRGGRAA